MAIHGTLATMSVPDLLQFLAAGRKTGTLKFSRGKLVKEIYFHNGLVVGANTNDPKEYLGQVLLHYGKLNESQLQLALEEQRRSGGKLGEILVARGFLTSPSVLEILRIRTLDIIYDLFIWEDAHFELFDSEPLPPDLIRIEVEPTTIIMEGIYRVDELDRYKTLIPSDRAVLELAAGWTASLSVSKEVRQILYFIEKRMSVAEICYNMHDSSFNIYAKLFDLVSNGIARVVEEKPKAADGFTKLPDLPENPSELIWLARRELKDENPEQALKLIHQILDTGAKNPEAQTLLAQAEAQFIKKFYTELTSKSVPQIIMSGEGLTQQVLGPREAFVLSRINGEWDLESILAICPFSEVDCLRMIKALIDAKVIGF
jgi:Domain of unknown function (DUF4388)